MQRNRVSPDQHIGTSNAVDPGFATGASIAAVGFGTAIGYGAVSTIHTAISMPWTTLAATAVTTVAVPSGVAICMKSKKPSFKQTVNTTATAV